jgi:cytosine deaminase
MLEVAHMAVHVGQMTGVEETQTCFDAVTTSAARAMQLDDYGIEPGNSANLVILDCNSAIDAIRLRPARLKVIRHGKVIAETAKAHPTVMLHGETNEIDFVPSSMKD